MMEVRTQRQLLELQIELLRDAERIVWISKSAATMLENVYQELRQKRVIGSEEVGAITGETVAALVAASPASDGVKYSAPLIAALLDILLLAQLTEVTRDRANVILSQYWRAELPFSAPIAEPGRFRGADPEASPTINVKRPRKA